jgi:hypothetical protein
MDSAFSPAPLFDLDWRCGDWGEQRANTEYVYEKLDQKMDAGFTKIDGRFGRLERKIDQIIDLHVPRTPPNESNAG